MILSKAKYTHVPVGHRIHRLDVTNDTPDNTKQHWWKVNNKLSLTDSPPQ